MERTARDSAAEIVRVLQRHRHIAVFAGGCVRDEILGREPKDFDVATSALPDEVEALFPRTVAVGKAFGVIVVVDGEHTTEVATLRSDGEYSDGRRPENVEFVTSLQQDATRRDLTINAMFLDPSTGEIHDFFGGQGDLRRGIVRSVGNALDRFREDNLRMMRALRFAARFGFSIDAEMLDAIKQHAVAIRQVSAERIAAELSGILTSANPVIGVDLLTSTGLMQHVLPEVAALVDPLIDGQEEQSASLWQRTRGVVAQLSGSSFELMLAGLLHNIDNSMMQQLSSTSTSALGKMAESICRRLKLTRDQRLRVTALVARQALVRRVRDLSVADLVALLERKDIHDLIALQHAIAVEAAFLSQRDFLLNKLRELDEETIASKRLGAKSLVTGELLLRLGFSRGPIFKQIIDLGMKAQREGVFVDAAAAEAWVRAQFDPAVGPSS